MRQVPTGWTGPDVSYLTFTAQWDGQWYQHIAEQGYPRRLPTDANGLVQQNAWAFYPLFPFLSRVLMDLTHLDFYWVGSTLSLLLGFVAAGAMALLLRDRIGARFTMAAVVLWGEHAGRGRPPGRLHGGHGDGPPHAVPPRPEQGAMAVGHVARAPARADPTHRRADRGRHRRGALVPVASAGPSDRWRPPRSSSGLAALAGASSPACSGRSIAGAVTGQGERVHGDHVDVAGQPGDRPVPTVAGHVAVLLRTDLGTGVADRPLRRHRRRWSSVPGRRASDRSCGCGPWPTRTTCWSSSTRSRRSSATSSRCSRSPPSSSALPATRRWRTWRRWVWVRFGVLLVAFVVGQWYWIDILWRFVPPTDYPP